MKRAQHNVLIECLEIHNKINLIFLIDVDVIVCFMHNVHELLMTYCHFSSMFVCASSHNETVSWVEMYLFRLQIIAVVSQ